jgi:Antitoxin VbhA
MVAEQEQLERRVWVQSALASQRMEGLEPDKKVQEDAQKWTRGEITIAAAVAAFKARLQIATT